MSHSQFGFSCKGCGSRLQPSAGACKLCLGSVPTPKSMSHRAPMMRSVDVEPKLQRKRIAGIYNVAANPKKIVPIPEKRGGVTRLVCMSDTHTLHSKFDSMIPAGDIFIHCGDFSLNGGESETLDFVRWLSQLPFEHKIVIAGNHESTLDVELYEAHWWRFHPKKVDQLKLKEKLMSVCTYLEDEIADIAGIRFCGSPWVRQYHDWAFNLNDDKRKELWTTLPQDLDVLITHCPPSRSLGFLSNRQDHGCDSLREAVDQVKPLLHLFGHVHEGYGVQRKKPTTFVNCSSVTQTKKPINQPIVIDLEDAPPRRDPVGPHTPT